MVRTNAIVAVVLSLAAGRADASLPPFADDRTGASAAVLEHVDSLMVSVDPRDALTVLGRILVGHPRDARLWVRVAYLNEEIGDPISAERAYRKALAIEPESYGTSFNFARLLALESRPDEALDLLAGQMEYGAYDPDYWYLTGLILLGTGLFDESIAALQRASELAPERDSIVDALREARRLRDMPGE